MKNAVLVLLVYCCAASAGAITFLPECSDWYMKQVGSNLELRCRSNNSTWLTVSNCPQASAKRDPAGNVRISCNGRPSNTVIGK